MSKYGLAFTNESVLHCDAAHQDCTLISQDGSSFFINLAFFSSLISENGNLKIDLEAINKYENVCITVSGATGRCLTNLQSILCHGECLANNIAEISEIEEVLEQIGLNLKVQLSSEKRTIPMEDSNFTFHETGCNLKRA